MIIQTVQIFAPNAPPAPYVVRAADGGWHRDCGNVSGWSLFFPRPCDCGHCLKSFERIRVRARRRAHAEGALYYERGKRS